MPNPSALPTSLQDKRAKMEAESSTPPVQTPPVENTPALPATGRVDISRDEFNELQAAAARARAAEGRAQSMVEDMEVLRLRLTEVERGSKDSQEPRQPARPSSSSSRIQFDTATENLTDKEKEDFEQDTINLVLKLARNVAREEIAKVLPQINDNLDSVESTAKTAANSAGSIRSNSFNDKVRDEVKKFSDFDVVVGHKHWAAFLQGEDEDNGEDFATVLTRNVGKENLKGVVRVFKVFFDKYLKDEVGNSGYSGADRSGISTVDTGNKEGSKKDVLKLSDRKKLHKQRIDGHISHEEYEVEKAKFDLADKEGRLDYDN